MLQILPVMSMEILYEDPHLLGVSKPSGQVVIPGRGDLPGEPLLAEAQRHAGRKIYVIHRLDRGASGIVLFAKDAPAHRNLSRQFEHREVKKAYQVLVQGLVDAPGKIDGPLRLFGSGRMGIDARGKPSMTEYQVRERLPAGQAGLRGATLLDVSPQTGRRHQIRVHLCSIGHPVMGDPLYGKDRPVGGVSRLMLHACLLEFRHPSGELLTLRADPPHDFMEAMKAFRDAGQ